MRILLSNHHLTDYTGSEIFTFTIAKFLKKRGHKAIVYSKFVDKMLPFFEKENISVINNLETIKNINFDLASVSHNINACEIRYYFPKLLIIYLAQGIMPVLEQPPTLNLSISLFLAISNSVRNNLIKKGIAKNKIKIFRNLVDENLFKSTNELNQIPKKALILSNHHSKNKEKVIKSALTSLKINYQFVGQGYQVIKPTNLPGYINGVDVVISLGRGAIGTMMCGRIPIIFDYLGGDGIVTVDNFTTLMKNNFSGSFYRHQYTADELIAEIKKYKKEEGRELRKLAIKYYGANKNIDKLIEIYQTYKNTKVKPLTTDENYQLRIFVEQIKETKKYSENIILTKSILKQLNYLNIIKISKFYKLWRLYYLIKDKFLKNYAKVKKNER